MAILASIVDPATPHLDRHNIHRRAVMHASRLPINLDPAHLWTLFSENSELYHCGTSALSVPSVPSVPLWPIHGFPKLCLGSSRVASIRGLGVDPMLDMRLEETQRDRALLQDGVVEGAAVEFGAEPPFCFAPQPPAFKLP